MVQTKMGMMTNPKYRNFRPLFQSHWHFTTFNEDNFGEIYRWCRSIFGPNMFEIDVRTLEPGVWTMTFPDPAITNIIAFKNEEDLCIFNLRWSHI